MREGSQSLPKQNRVRRIQNDEFLHQLQSVMRDLLADHPTPIVPDEDRALRSDNVNQADDVFCKKFYPALVNTCRLGREVGTSKVRRHDVKSCGRQSRDLKAPQGPEILESMQQQDDRPGPGLDVMEAQTIMMASR